ERSFWDKIVILHGLRRWFDIRGELKGNGQRVSRHYYNVCQLLASEAGQQALKDRGLGADCVAHARMFFDRTLISRQRPLPHSPFVPKGRCSTISGGIIVRWRV